MAEEEMKPRSAVLREALERAKESGKKSTSLLSVPEASAQLRVSRWSLYRLINEGKLKSIKIGKRRLVSLKAVERFIEGLENEEAEV